MLSTRIKLTQLTTFVTCIAFSATTAFGEAAVLLKEVPVEYLGGAPNHETEKAISGTLTITTEVISFTSRKATFNVPTEEVTLLSGGEFAKRRVKGALVGAILLTPLFLFALIGKKKREILVVEYSNDAKTVAEGERPKLTGAPVFRYKPKGGRALAIEKAIESATGLNVFKEGDEVESDVPKQEETQQDEGRSAPETE